MAFKMKKFSGFMQKDEDKKILKKSNKRLIKEQREKFRKGDITREEFKAAKKEIQGYTDVDAAKDHLFDEPVKRSDFPRGSKERKMFNERAKQAKKK
tara:strand:+ start:230 stop:520 length:291 start_codon:yes stop_codon:yes gene_type:complete